MAYCTKLLLLCCVLLSHTAYGEREGQLKVFYTEENPERLSYSSVTVSPDDKRLLKLKNPSDYLEKKLRTLEMEKQEEVRKKQTFQSAKAKQRSKDAEKPQKFLKNEKSQLCQSLSTDSVKDSLLKFGLVTHIIPEVEKFRNAMKMLKDSVPRNKKKTGMEKKSKMAGNKEGRVKLNQGNYVGRSFHGILVPSVADYRGAYEDGNNNLHKDGRDEKMLGAQRRRDQEKRMREERRKREAREFEDTNSGSYLATMRRDTRRKGTSKNFDQVPQCFGWRYLSAINALNQGNSVDLDYLTQSVSDMLDITFAETVVNILQGCHAKIQEAETENMCPPAEEVGLSMQAAQSCDSTCADDSECGFKELCCRQGCGGNKCVSVKARSNKCSKADQFLQCIYTNMDYQLCDSK